MPAYDALPELPDPPRPGAARARRRAHGRRLRARLGQGRRLRRHLGSRRDQPGDRHRQRDDGFDPDGVHHRARSRRTLIGSDAFQETDITGVTLPITKHNFLVTRAQDIMPAIKQAFYIASSGRPGPVLVDITKDAQNAELEYGYDAVAGALAGLSPRAAPAARGARATRSR